MMWRHFMMCCFNLNKTCIDSALGLSVSSFINMPSRYFVSLLLRTHETNSQMLHTAALITNGARERWESAPCVDWFMMHESMICDAERERRRSVMSDVSFNKKLHCSEEQDDGWMRSVSHLDLLFRSIRHFKSLAVCRITDEEMSRTPVESIGETNLKSSEKLQHSSLVQL